MTVTDFRSSSHCAPPVAPTPHYRWCADHDHRFPTVHESEVVELAMPAGWLDGTLQARIAVDDDFALAPEVVLSVDGSGMSLNRDEAVAFVGALRVFAGEVERLVAAAGPV